MQRAFRLVVLFFLGLSVLPCLARSAQDSSPIEKSSEARANASETVAILPFIYENGTPGAHTAAEEFMETTLTKSQYFRADSFRIISQAQVTLAWTKDMGFGECTERTPAKLLRLGEKLGVDWVISGRAYWHTRSVWIGLGPKTKSDCTLDMMIVDVKRA